MMVGYSSFNVWVLSLQSFHVVSFNGGSQYVVKKGTSMVVPQPTAFGFAGKKTQTCSYCGASSAHIQSGYTAVCLASLKLTAKTPENWCFGRWTFLFKSSNDHHMAYFHRVGPNSCCFVPGFLYLSIPCWVFRWPPMDPHQCGPSWARSRRNVLKVPTLVPLESSTPHGMGWCRMAGGSQWRSQGFCRCIFWVLAHHQTCGISHQTKLISHKKSPRKLQSKNQTRKIKFPFWEKKTSAHLVFRILLPVPEKGTMWGVPSKYCIRDWTNLGKDSNFKNNVCLKIGPHICMCVCLIHVFVDLTKKKHKIPASFQKTTSSSIVSWHFFQRKLHPWWPKRFHLLSTKDADDGILIHIATGAPGGTAEA